MPGWAPRREWPGCRPPTARAGPPLACSPGGTARRPVVGGSALAGAPPWVVQLLLCLVGRSAGGFTILHSLEALRARILRGALPWLGITAGFFFLVMWLGILVGLVPLIAAGFFAGSIFYFAWAIWLGVRLGRRAPVVAVVT